MKLFAEPQMEVIEVVSEKIMTNTPDQEIKSDEF